MRDWNSILADEASDTVAKARLDSWKAIAEYLKRSPRTVQRWHASFGLPVHHFGGSKGPVYSYSDELDAWLSGFSQETGEGVSGVDHQMSARRKRSSELAAEADELWEIRTEDNLTAIASLYRSAVDLNPANGPAFIGMANAITLSALVGVMRGSAAYPRAADAIQRAIRAGHDGPATQCASAWLQMLYEKNWRKAREGFEGTLLSHPQSNHGLMGMALLHVAEGNLAAAMQRLGDAWKQNTLVTPTAALLGWVYYLQGSYKLALETVTQARLSGDLSALAIIVEALIFLQSEPVTAAVQIIEGLAGSHPDNAVLHGILGLALVRSDRSGRASEILHRLDRMQGDASFAAALILLGLDERQQAMSRLETCYAEGSLWSLSLRSDPALEQLREGGLFGPRLKRLSPG